MKAKSEFKTVVGDKCAILKIAEGETWEGTIIGIREKDGKMKSAMLEMADKDGEMFGLWMSKAIEDARDHLKADYRIRVTYRGQKKLKGGHRFNDYVVAVAEPV